MQPYQKSRVYWIAIWVIIFMMLTLLGWYWFVARERAQIDDAPNNILGLLNIDTNSSSLSGLFGTPVSDDDTNTDPDDARQEQAKLMQVTTTPVAGFVPYDTTDTIARTRYVERATGDVYEFNMGTSRATRVLHATIPRTLDAWFVDNGRSVIRRYVDDRDVLTSVLSPIGGSADTPGVDHSFLSPSIFALAVDASGTHITTARREAGVTYVEVLDTNGEVLAPIFSSLLAGWTLNVEDTTLLITQNAANDIPGASFVVNTTTADTRQALSSIRGVSTVLAPDATRILYSRATGNNIQVLVYNLETRSETILPIDTIAEKCAWSRIHPTIIYCAVPASTAGMILPDQWYRGEVSLNDSLWRINVTDNTAEMLLNPEESLDQTMDIERPMLNKDESYLFFRDHHSHYLKAISIPTYTTRAQIEAETDTSSSEAN